jgi:transcriptional regulator with XRE-family HTH domain
MHTADEPEEPMTSTTTERSCTSCAATITCEGSRPLCDVCAKNDRNGWCPLPQPSTFWDDRDIRSAINARSFGDLLKAYRLAHRPVVKQAQLAKWLGITQGQVSRLESGRTSAQDIEKLTRWSRVLHVPLSLMWFSIEYSPHTSPFGVAEPQTTMALEPRAPEDYMKRRDLFKITGVAASLAVTATLPSSIAALTEKECAERVAWELWQRNATVIHISELPLSVATYLGAVDASGRLRRASRTGTISPDGLIVGDADNYFSFVQPALVDVFVGQHIFRGITKGHSNLLAAAQTSHATDLVLQQLVERDPGTVKLLHQWMRSGVTPVLQVNSAGILAKTPHPQMTDATVAVLKTSAETRQLYMTAVLSRVLQVDWSSATQMTSQIERGELVDALPESHVNMLASELHNKRDGAARWCSIVTLGLTGADGSDRARSLLHQALQKERSVENLRAIGNVLAGSNPLTI